MKLGGSIQDILYGDQNLCIYIMSLLSAGYLVTRKLN